MRILRRLGLTDLAAMVTNKASSKEIEKIADSLNILPEENLPVLSSESANVAAVQLQLRSYSSLTEYIEDMNRYIADAANRRAQLICFPTWAGMLPLSFTAPLGSILPALRPQGNSHLPDADALFSVISCYGDLLLDTFTQVFSALAARHRVYILAGSIPCFEGEELYLRALLFNHEGEICGSQDKISLTPYEQEVGFSTASELRVFETPAGTSCILSGSDADYFELTRIAKNMGAQILLGSRLFYKEYGPVQAALGLNMRVQEAGLYGVQSALVGKTSLGFTLEGAAQIFAPNELVRTKNGIFMQSHTRYEPDVVCAQLSLENLDEPRNPYLQDKNSELMRKYLDRLY